MDELSAVRDRRRQAERLYKQAVKNLGIKPTNMERRDAIAKIMAELKSGQED